MKRSCLIFFFILAVSAAREKESISRVEEAFHEGVMDFRMPSMIMNGVPTNELIEDLTQATAEFLTNNLKQFDRRIYELQSIGIDSIETAGNYLFNKLERWGHTNNPYLLEEDLKKMNSIINEIIKADPQIKHYIEPKINKPEKEIVPIYGRDESSEIFRNLPNLVARNMKSIIPLFHNLFLSGMEKAILAITDLNNELRNTYLHGKLIPALFQQINRINKRKSQIINYVSRETWIVYNRLSNIFINKIKPDAF